MASLKALKGRIASVKSTQKITKAMKMVAAAKLRRAQQAAEAGRPYAERMESVMASLAAKVGDQPAEPEAARRHGPRPDPSARRRAPPTGASPERSTRTSSEPPARRPTSSPARARQVLFYLVGRKGRAVIQRLYPKQIIHQHDTSAMKFASFADAQAIAEDLVDRYQTDGIDVVHLFYARFQSALVQEPVGQQIIPVSLPEGGDKAPPGSSAADRI